MKIEVMPQLNPVEVLRRAGYGQVMDRRASEPSWSRRLGSGFYPRFHAYVNGNVINLHLDQKQASYEGSSAHSGEYDGPTVETEALRIVETANQIIKTRSDEANLSASTDRPKTGFWGKIFGN